MRILVLGAGGFIGRHIVAELLRGGHQPVGAVRRVADFARAFPGVAAIACDLARDVSVSDWLPRVDGIDVVVNAAGVLSGAEMEAVHVTAPRALYLPSRRFMPRTSPGRCGSFARRSVSAARFSSLRDLRRFRCAICFRATGHGSVCRPCPSCPFR